MLDIQSSPTLPRFAFGEYDEVIMDGISYRITDFSDDGYVFVRTNGSGVAEAFSHAVLSQRVTLGNLEHRRDAFLPEHAKRRLKSPSEVLSNLTPKQHQKAKRPEALVRAFLEMEAAGKVKRTDDSINAVLTQIQLRAGQILSIPSEGDTGKAGSKTIIVPKISASRLRKIVKRTTPKPTGLITQFGSEILNGRP